MEILYLLLIVWIPIIAYFWINRKRDPQEDSVFAKFLKRNKINSRSVVYVDTDSIYFKRND